MGLSKKVNPQQWKIEWIKEDAIVRTDYYQDKRAAQDAIQSLQIRYAGWTPRISECRVEVVSSYHFVETVN